jgi:hypothetical protein
MSPSPKKQTLLSQAHYDKSGVICFFNSDQDECYNPFEVAVQALIGDDVMIPYRAGFPGLKPRLYDIRHLPDPTGKSQCKAAIDWLCANHSTAVDGGAVWQYRFDLVFYDTYIPAPWASAFGQAYVMLALLFWYRHSHDPLFLDLAVRAAVVLRTDISRGGVRFSTGEKESFFEEVPSPSPTHILNAHLLALIALYELREEIAEQWLSDLINEGMNAARRLLPSCDTGRWSLYHLPAWESFSIRLAPCSEDYVAVKSISLHVEPGNDITLLPTEPGHFSEGSTRLAGIDWGSFENIGGIKARVIRYGPSLHPVSVPTGTRQNTYAYFEYRLVDATNTADMELEIEAFCKAAAKMKVELRIPEVPDLQFVCPNDSFVLQFEKGWNTRTVRIRKRHDSYLHSSYHKFHVNLLETLFRLSKDPDIDRFRERFNEYLHKPRIEESVPPVPEFPPTIFFSINSECGLKCKMCDVGSRNPEATLYKFLHPSPHAVLSVQTIENVAREVQGKTERFAFIGTEPMLHPDLDQISAVTKRYGVKTQLTTNGINLDKKYKVIIDNGVDELWLSIDGPPAVHDDIRGHAGLFENIHSGLLSMLDYASDTGRQGPAIFVSYTISNLNYACMEDFLISFEDIPYRCVCFYHLNFVTPDIAARHNAAHPDLLIGPSTTNPSIHCADIDMLAFHSSCERLKLRYGNKVSFTPDLDFWELVDFYRYPETLISRHRCTVPWTCMQVLADGSCVAMSRCYVKFFGNVNETSVRDIWNGTEINEFRIELWNQKRFEPCLRCCGIL